MCRERQHIYCRRRQHNYDRREYLPQQFQLENSSITFAAWLTTCHLRPCPTFFPWRSSLELSWVAGYVFLSLSVSLSLIYIYWPHKAILYILIYIYIKRLLSRASFIVPVSGVIMVVRPLYLTLRRYKIGSESTLQLQVVSYCRKELEPESCQ